MAVIWAPATKGDFVRIHQFNKDAYSQQVADEVHNFILDAGEHIRPASGAPWAAINGARKTRTTHPFYPARITHQYNLFFWLTVAGEVEISPFTTSKKIGRYCYPRG
ncbi:MAG: hypothetical protein WCC64_15915 [Aliidongia sp.]